MSLPRGSLCLVSSVLLGACAAAPRSTPEDETLPPAIVLTAVAPVPATQCTPQMPAPIQAERLALPVTIAAGSAPLAANVPVVAPSGREYSLSFFGFYVAQPLLLDAANIGHPATFLAPSGQAQPYDVHVIDLRDPTTHVLRLAAPPGTYAGLQVNIGMPEVCRTLDPHMQVFPLNSESGMTWDWAGYLHLRYEGSVRASATSAPMFALHHMFQAESFATVVIPGALTVGKQPVGPGVVLDIERMLDRKGGLAPQTAHGIDGWVMDNLEQNQAFALR